MNIEGALDRELLRVARQIPDVRIETTGRPDITIRAGDASYPVQLKAERILNAAAARQAIEHAQHLPADAKLVVLAATSTADARRLLHEAGIGLLDGAGHIRLDLPGIYVWADTDPATPAPGHTSPARLSGKAGLAALALLDDPSMPWRVADLADRAGISVGLAHRVLARLDREGLTDSTGAGPRRTRTVLNPAALLDLWAEEMRDRGVHQVRGYRLARDARAQAIDISRALDDADIAHAITGPAAAAELAPFITAIPITDVWITETANLDQTLTDLGAEPAPTGHNLILRSAIDDLPLALRQRVHEMWITNTYRLYLDLRQDPRRGREQADRLRQEVIGF